LDDTGCLKISDFGLSTLQLKHEDRCHTQCGTPNYVAPEVISRSIQGYDGAKVDVWSSGIVLYVLVAGELPFDDNDPSELFRKIVAGVFELPHWFSEPLRDLLPHLLELEPENRYDLEQIRSHPWYTQQTPPAPPPLRTPAGLPVTPSTLAEAAHASASCTSVAVSVPREREEDDALFPGMNFINPTFKPTDTPGNVHPDVALSIGQPSEALSVFAAPAAASVVGPGSRLPVTGGLPDTVLRSGAVPPLPPPTARRPRSRGNSYLSRFQSAEHLSDGGMDVVQPGTMADVVPSDGEASIVGEELESVIATTSALPPPPRLGTGTATVRHAPMAMRAAAPPGASAAASLAATSPTRSVRQDNIDRVAAELMAANDSAPLNESQSALNQERMRRYLIQQTEQVLQQNHGNKDADLSADVGVAPALSAEGIRRLADAREAAAVAVAASVAPAPSPHVQMAADAAATGAGVTSDGSHVPAALPAAGADVGDVAFGVPPLPLGAVDSAVRAALDAKPGEDLDDAGSSRANQFDDAPADTSADAIDSALAMAGTEHVPSSLLSPRHASPAPLRIAASPPVAPDFVSLSGSVAAAVPIATLVPFAAPVRIRSPVPVVTPTPVLAATPVPAATSVLAPASVLAPTSVLTSAPVTTLPPAAALAVVTVDSDRGADGPCVMVSPTFASPLTSPVLPVTQPQASPLVDLTAAVSCNLCVGCAQGGACESPVNVNAGGYNRVLDSQWQQLVDTCTSDSVDGGAAVVDAPHVVAHSPKLAPLTIEHLQSSHTPDRSPPVPVSPLPVGAHHGSHGHGFGHVADAGGDRRGTYSRRERGSASGSTRSRRSSVANGESDKHRNTSRHDKSMGSAVRRRSRTSFDSKHGLQSRSSTGADAPASEADHVRIPFGGVDSDPTPGLPGRNSSDIGPLRSSSSLEDRKAASSGALPRSSGSSASGHVPGSTAGKREGYASGPSDGLGSGESDDDETGEARGGARVVRPSSAGSRSSSGGRRVQSGDSSAGRRGVSSPMTSGGNFESQLTITRDHQLLKHIGKPWRAVGRGRAEKQLEEARTSPGPSKALFPPALADDGELVVIAGDEPCLTPASPDALVSIGSAVGSDGHPPRQLHGHATGSGSDDVRVPPAGRAGSSRGPQPVGAQPDDLRRSSRSLVHSGSSRDGQSRSPPSRGVSPTYPTRYDRQRSPADRQVPRRGSTRSSQLDERGFKSSRSGRREHWSSGHHARSSRGDSAPRSSTRTESRRSSRRGSPSRSSRRDSPSRSARRRSRGEVDRRESSRAGDSYRSSRRRSPDALARRDRSAPHSRSGSPRWSSRRGSPRRSSHREGRRYSASKSSRHGSPGAHRREYAPSSHRGSRASNSSRRRHGSHSTSRQRERDDPDYSELEAGPTPMRHESMGGRAITNAPALALVSSRRDGMPSESSSGSLRSRAEGRHRDPTDVWAAGGGTGSTSLTDAVDHPGSGLGTVAGSLEGSTVTSVTGTSSSGAVEVPRLGGFKGVTSRLLAKAPMQLGTGRNRRFTEFNSLLPPRATMEKLVRVLRGTAGVQSVDPVEVTPDTLRVHVRSLVAATGRTGAELLRATVSVFRREPAGLTVVSFRRSKGRQDGEDFKAWYAAVFSAFCNYDESERVAAKAKGAAI